jgi:SAM-dependent methyltransferase
LSHYVCRFCDAPLKDTFVDLGVSPLSNSYIDPSQRHRGEIFFPLHVYVCRSCFLVQLPEFESPENIFSDYAYFSSFSDSWLVHCEQYANHVVEQFNLGQDSKVIELASNDGYLLQFFKSRGIPVLGVEPAKNVATVAKEREVPTIVRFFGSELAKNLIAEGETADLLIANNVLAHVPDLNDFVSGMKLILAKNGTITVEVPHLRQLIAHCQFDTIYHEHLSYFSLFTLEQIFARHELCVFDVEELETHGGSLRIYVQHAGHPKAYKSERLEALRDSERDDRAGMIETYIGFADRVSALKRDLLTCLINLKREGKHIAGYGAPAKGNTLLNYCGIGTDFIDYTVDRNPEKQGRLLPGSGIPVYTPSRIEETRPDYVLILPWNIKKEIIEQMSTIRTWGGAFILPIPSPVIVK